MAWLFCCWGFSTVELSGSTSLFVHVHVHDAIGKEALLIAGLHCIANTIGFVLRAMESCS
jgi:hypothetical protein